MRYKMSQVRRIRKRFEGLNIRPWLWIDQFQTQAQITQVAKKQLELSYFSRTVFRCRLLRITVFKLRQRKNFDSDYLSPNDGDLKFDAIALNHYRPFHKLHSGKRQGELKFNIL